LPYAFGSVLYTIDEVSTFLEQQFVVSGLVIAPFVVCNETVGGCCMRKFMEKNEQFRSVASRVDARHTT